MSNAWQYFWGKTIHTLMIKSVILIFLILYSLVLHVRKLSGARPGGLCRESVLLEMSDKQCLQKRKWFLDRNSDSKDNSLKNWAELKYDYKTGRVNFQQLKEKVHRYLLVTSMEVYDQFNYAKRTYHKIDIHFMAFGLINLIYG